MRWELADLSRLLCRSFSIAQKILVGLWVSSETIIYKTFSSSFRDRLEFIDDSVISCFSLFLIITRVVAHSVWVAVELNDVWEMWMIDEKHEFNDSQISRSSNWFWEHGISSSLTQKFPPLQLPRLRLDLVPQLVPWPAHRSWSQHMGVRVVQAAQARLISDGLWWKRH